MNRAPERPPDDTPPTLWQTIQSVVAAFFGVQSSRNRARDFTRGKPLHFIVVGLLMTVTLVGTLVLLVRLILQQAA